MIAEAAHTRSQLLVSCDDNETVKRFAGEFFASFGEVVGGVGQADWRFCLLAATRRAMIAFTSEWYRSPTNFMTSTSPRSERKD
jgi:hypothetical protein